jgi:hypothetical protein
MVTIGGGDRCSEVVGTQKGRRSNASAVSAAMGRGASLDQIVCCKVVLEKKIFGGVTNRVNVCRMVN